MMKKSILLIIFISSFNVLIAQRASFEKDEIFIGDQIELILEIPKNIGNDILFPVFENVIIEGIEILETSEVEFIEPENLLRQTYVITSFEDSLFLLYPFEFKVDNKIIKTNPLRLQVSYYKPDSILMSKIDTTGKLRIVDIKPPVETPMTFKEFINRFGIYIIAFLIVVILIFVVRYFYKKRKDNKLVFTKPKPKIPVHVHTLEQLKVLKKKELHKKEILKPFYTELSFIIRSYIENRFKIEALESITNEIIDEFSKTEFANDETISKLEELLSLSDLVKFAKNRPNEHENELMIEYAFSFVNLTKQEELAEQEIKNQEII
ncbi:MAG: BatD family protein [Bacteroidales bacterium]|nr:BatD family protein [Bacteroidales bacterium]